MSTPAGLNVAEPPPAESLVEARLAALRGRLLEWLVDRAYPLWARHGVDVRSGAFIEALGQDGRALPWPLRIRVQPRQIYAFASVAAFGWPDGPARTIVRRGVDAMIAAYRRTDGFYRALVDERGRVLDDRALLYDQAFVLLGLAAAGVALDARAEFEGLAR